MARGFERYGGTVEIIEFKPVNHVVYMSVKPVGAPPNCQQVIRFVSDHPPYSWVAGAQAFADLDLLQCGLEISA